jgi:hypothetical protein
VNHEVGDLDCLPEDLQLKIRDYAENNFLPDVLQYLGSKHPMFQKYSVYQVELHGFEFEPDILKGCISNEERYDLRQLQRLFSWPRVFFVKIQGRRLVGSALRICKAFNLPEHADAFKQIVEGYFTPHHHQDPRDPDRIQFDLHVEPSTWLPSTIQRNCCPKGD